MTDKAKSGNVNRRDFISAATGASIAAATLTNAGDARAQDLADGDALVAATPPHAAQMAFEGDLPDGYSAVEAREYFVSRPGSDFMVDVIKSLNLEYITTNPGSSFRGIHESIVNYGGNRAPELLTCPHEEQATAIAHGYAKVAGKPIGVLCHGTVGLQHAAMAVYNAWADRAPMVLLGGNHLDVTHRRTGAEWSHSAQDVARVLRDYIKWDDTPVSLQHYAESMARAYKIATTPPMGPVVVTIDGHLQEFDMAGESPSVVRMAPTLPPQGDAAAIDEAARWLVEAESPVIAVDLMAHDQRGVESLIELAEALQAPVVNQFGRMNFPNTHHLSQGGGIVAEADVILALELFDTWGVVNDLRDRVHKEEQRVARPDARVIDIGVKDLFMRSNYQSFQRFNPSDLSIAADAQATLPALIEAVERHMTRARRASNAARERRWREAHARTRARWLDAARYAWDASPISTGRIYSELWQLVKDREWVFVSDDNRQTRWARKLWPLEKTYQWLGRSGGSGVGYGAPSAVGAALAHRGQGRLPINIQTDGDMMYVPGVFWTAAHHRIPLLSIVHNNRGYHQELMHLQRMAARRQRGTDGSSKVGNELNDPPIDLAMVTRGMGVWSTGPITEPGELRGALERALDVVDNGEPALIDVVSQPR